MVASYIIEILLAEAKYPSLPHFFVLGDSDQSKATGT